MPYTPKKTVQTIVDSGNNYVVQVKGNQPTLHQEIQATMATQEPLDYFEVSEKGHGRHSTWYVSVFSAIPSEKKKEWKGLKRFVHVHKCTVTKKGESHSDRVYISSCDTTNAQYYHTGIREHWNIENRLHWVKDKIHQEDDNRIVTKHGPVNSNIFSTISINIHRKEGYQSVTKSQIMFGANIEKAFKIIRT